MSKRTWIRTYEVPVSTSGYTNPAIDIDLPRDAKAITGIRIESDEIAACYNRGFVGIEISNEEVVPPRTSVQMFMFSDASPEKFYRVGTFENKSAKMTVSIVDTGVYTFAAYTIRFVIEYEK